MSRMWKNQTYYLHQLCNKLHRPQCVSIMREENPVAMVMATTVQRHLCKHHCHVYTHCSV